MLKLILSFLNVRRREVKSIIELTQPIDYDNVLEKYLDELWTQDRFEMSKEFKFNDQSSIKETGWIPSQNTLKSATIKEMKRKYLLSAIRYSSKVKVPSPTASDGPDGMFKKLTRSNGKEESPF